MNILKTVLVLATLITAAVPLYSCADFDFAYGGFNHYPMGGFTRAGQPSQALIDIYKH